MCGAANSRRSASVGGSLAIARHDRRDADLAHDVVGARHDRDRGDVGMGRQHALDLDRVDVVAAADVHLLAPADEPQTAAVVDPAEVAGAHEAVGRERGARLLGVAPVARHDGGGAQAHLADVGAGDGIARLVAQRDLDARVRPAHADDRVLVGIVERGAEPDAGFGARVAGGEARAEAAARFLGEPGSDRPAARDDVLHRVQVEVVELGIAEHERELGRHARDRGHAFACEQFERGRARASVP